MSTALVVVTVVFFLFFVAFLGLSVWAFKRQRVLVGASHTIIGLLMLSIAALFGTLTLATQGYRALTREDLVARITTTQLAPQLFDAHVEFPDGRDTTFRLSGDEFYIDAHILKWKPIGNILGLHTDYELDRISGRFMELADEESKPRTIFALSTKKPINLFHLRRRYSIFAPLVDAEYGSATFIAAGDREEFEVTISTSGLLVRKTAGG